MARLDRKVVAITGVTRGLGRAMAREFARQGHLVLGCGRTLGAIEALKKELAPPHEFEAVDVADEGQIRSWATGILDRHGPPDLLLNNAATINANARLWEVPSDDFDRVVDVNIKGVAHAIRHLVPAMIGRGSGVIVNFSSGWGRSTAPEVAPYCASKWAIEGLTRALAQELPRGLAAIPLNPGIIDTEMLRSTFGGRASDFPNPDAWAEAAVPFLLGLGPKDNGRPLTVPGH
ncbi:SDR family oxidoreductase [Tundrisphaera lichenicola]|uniref:SDR family oxidoreductase n=1 Tax=Tundrisphaera lichenicola TaxID=2029860 RepID=UPI003EBF8B39